ncbi:gliding motility lipoprotein GldJ [Lutibacter sp. TH_r2]|uniref:gliding motility lipoprotein GldJ n=1 Tax=Lutibacter sp. TH_r2 TaxID=3082083 RepID=UPI0029544678|nr:gliding motility lipoprotein GldJ [Lutibacter sp. TH_r2]MDV7188572.1 gliding motility lipoprotein GldJ [Lutibacter sp. TH_r2]
MKKINSVTKLGLLAILMVSLVSCHNRSYRNNSSLTGWNSKDKSAAGFSSNTNYKGQETPPGMVLIEGGTFTMGHVQDDVLFDWNTTPVKQQVRSFYLDESEVTNSEYLFYLEYMEKVFPTSNVNYKDIYQSAVPDTLVWRDVLGFNELLTENYLRHPAYADYPVVGVSWVQANQYCKWRTEMVNSKILRDRGILKDLFSLDSVEVMGQNRFDTDAYLANPANLFEGDSTIYAKGLPSNVARKKGEARPERGAFTGRHAKVSDGLLSPKFRLPTEAEWEYAAKANVENREYNNIRGRKKYAWDGKYTRNKSRRTKGDQLANFKQGKGDYSGIAGWSNDGADITIAVKQYDPNAFGLYDMSGNVAEWVADVYRPIIDNDANDFNYFRGNIFTKKMIDAEGKVVIVDDFSVEYDTLDNGKLIPKALPGSIKYIPITKRDAYMRNNYEKAYNVDSNDGDLASTKLFDKEEDELETKPRMYNSPVRPRTIGESGLLMQEYDSEHRTTLVSDKTRVYKGGSWKDREYWLDPAQRRYLPEYMATNYIGFRCATTKLGPMTYKRRKPTTTKVRY